MQHTDTYIDPSFLDSPPELPPLPELRGTALDMSQMPESARVAYTPFEKPLRMVGIRFAETGHVYDFDASTLVLKMGDAVVADLPEKGIMMGWVSKPAIKIENKDIRLNPPPLLRKATEGDHETYQKIQSLEKEAVLRTQNAISRFNLPMRVLKVNYTLDLRKAIVYFYSEERVDFRILLKELIHDLKAKIELRQVGARDETKLLGGIGPCGEELCCSRFIDKFHNVTIKMAKDQELSLKPTKVAGMCGRLKCCLAYEDQAYAEAKRSLPKKGKCVKCKSGGACGIVTDLDVLRGRVTVEFEDGGIQILPASEVIEEKSMPGNFKYKNEKRVDEDDEDLKRLED